MAASEPPSRVHLLNKTSPFSPSDQNFTPPPLTAPAPIELFKHKRPLKYHLHIRQLHNTNPDYLLITFTRNNIFSIIFTSKKNN